jgi:hypothetical protein
LVARTLKAASSLRINSSPKRERFVFQSTLEAIEVMRGETRRESDRARDG